ncbi:flagellin N-terminal helical domain-containing protein [Aneurinibacillus tyrosinisolvens]|uniref:flagellin N-terminal helical domain-containing protein n=1 Tax=Aneurinibacillus tyrosinisolvens TaxID=1443435 RepID=UPI00063F0582|nr:flagellin [Aneurinibacillus tyrosinisolvens]
MRINHNITSLNTYRQLSTNNENTSKSIEKLSSGLRINRAGDDAAGLAISEKMRGQIRGLDQASRNSQDAISMIQTAEGALNETHSILQRMRELAVQSSTDTNTADDRSKIQSEVDQLAKEITRISNTTEFNTQNLLAGGLNDTFHIGANAGQSIGLAVNAMDAFSLGVAANVNVAGAFNASTTGLTAAGVTNAGLGRGLVADTYKIVVTANASTATQTAGQAATFTGANAFTGARNESATFKVTAVNVGNQATAAQVSTDGGTTWTAVNTTQVAGGGEFVYKGVTVQLTATTAVGNQVSVDFAAKNNTLQLQTSGAVNIGSAATVYSDMQDVTIGNAATAQTMKISSSSFGSLGGAATATQVVNAQASSAATTNAGTVTAQAVAQAGVDVSTQSSANTAITTVDSAIKKVSEERSKLGAYQNRLEHTIANLNTSSENLTASESRVRDVDMAKEVMNQTKNNILAQAAQAMLAQANQQPQGVLQLLRG